MLTSEHAIVEYKSGQAIADRLTQKTHQQYLKYADQMLSIYQNGLGEQRRFLHRKVEALFVEEPDCPLRRISAFCKLLDDQSDYQSDPLGQVSDLRLKVFSAAARLHPLVQQPDKLFECDEIEGKKRIADELGLSPHEIEKKLYSDVISFQRLKTFEGYPDAAGLLSRYNVAQLQACLYRAHSMTVVATDDFATIMRYAKLARLLHEIERLGPSSYKIIFTGPASVLRETRRYGIRFAKFLPALLACKGWQMTALLQTPWEKQATLHLSEQDAFSSHLPEPDQFDSSLEETFAKKFGPTRDGWQLIREGEILHEQQTTFVPDFVFRHEDGTEVLLEIVGFWTPEYLEHRRQTLRRFRHHEILIAVPEKSLRDEAVISARVIVYKTVIKIRPVLEALENMRANVHGPCYDSSSKRNNI